MSDLADPDYWRAVLGTAVEACAVEPMPGGNSASRLWRVRLTGRGLPVAVVVKETAGPWPADDPGGRRREHHVYTRLLAGVSGVAPALLHAQCDACRVRLVLADLEPDYTFREPSHLWRHDEIDVALEVLARLHGATAGRDGLDDPCLMPAPDRRWSAAQIAADAQALDGVGAPGGGRWRFAALAAQALRRFPPAAAAAPPVLAHSDFSTANFALAARGVHGRLVDWHIAAAAAPADDVAALLFQPHANHRRLDWDRLCRGYGRARARLGLAPFHAGGAPEAAFRAAVAGCALSYIPPIAGQARHGPLAGWWLHTATAVHDNLALCLEAHP